MALEILLGTKPEHVKINVLVFLQEECLSLFRDDKILWCFFTTAKSMLTHPRAFSSLIRGQMLVTATTILIEVDTITINPSLFRSFVILLHSVAADTFNASTCYLRQMACESLRELELTYPTLLAEFVNETLSGRPASALPASASSLLRFFQEERSHISQSYALLYLTVLEHAVAEDDDVEDNDVALDEDGNNFDRHRSGEDEDDYDEGRDSDMDSFSDDSSYGRSEEERLSGDATGDETGESSGRDSYFYENEQTARAVAAQMDAQQSQVSGIPATPVTRVNFVSSPPHISPDEMRKTMNEGGGEEGAFKNNYKDKEQEEEEEEGEAAAQPLTTALTASLGNVPTPILREAIAGLVHQLASTVKRPGYSVPEKTVVLIRPVNPSKLLCSHFPPSMLDFADNRPRKDFDEEDVGTVAETEGHRKKQKEKQKRNIRGETMRTFFDSVVKKLTRALSLVLENSTLFSQWGLVHMITKIVPFSRRMGLQPSIFRHHFYGMAFTQSPLLYHVVSCAIPPPFVSRHTM